MDYIKFFSGHTIMSLRVVGAVAVVGSILLSGCALSPGHYLDTDEIVGDSSLENSQVEFIPITPDVIAGEITGRTVATVPAELLAFEPGNYRIGPSDGLFVTVWDHPELTAPSGMQLQGEANGRTVGPDGQLFYPYIGNISAAGKTIDELRTEIAQRLTKYIEDPQVDVNVFRFSSQRVLLSGAFQRTLPIPVTTRPLSLVEALGQAGVDAADADLSSVSLIRNGKNYVLDVYALTSQPSDIHRVYLRDGDSIHLPYNDTNKVYVMGEIMRPQALKFKSDSMNLTDAIGSAGGLSQMTAKGQDVYVIRGVENLAEQKAKIFQLNAKSPSAFILSGMFQLQPQDVVYVGAAGITRWNRVISQMLPSLTLLSLTSRTAQSVDTMNNQ